MDKLGKGRAIEEIVMKHWWKQDYAVWRPARSKYSSQDLFGLFDFIAVREGRVDLVQVKRHRPKEVKAAQEAIVSFLRAKRPPVHAYMALWVKRVGNVRSRPVKGLLFWLYELQTDWVWKWVDAWWEDA